MREILILHPDSRCGAVACIAAEAMRTPGKLALRYCLSGTVAGVRLPSIGKPAAAHELWRHTCFEAFIRPESGDAYYEFNFSPSLQWAAYRFERYRSGMRDMCHAFAPRVEVRSDGTGVDLQASLDLRSTDDLSTRVVWRLGLAAVIEEEDGRLSWWALAHPPGKPDFHHSDCFARELPPR